MPSSLATAAPSKKPGKVADFLHTAELAALIEMLQVSETERRRINHTKRC
jgi:hypothetical protein